MPNPAVSAAATGAPATTATTTTTNNNNNTSTAPAGPTQQGEVQQAQEQQAQGERRQGQQAQGERRQAQRRNGQQGASRQTERPPNYHEDIDFIPDEYDLCPPIDKNNRIILPEVLPQFRDADLAPFSVIEPQRGARKLAAAAWLFRQEKRFKDLVTRTENAKMPPPDDYYLIRAVQAGWGRLAATPCDRCVADGKLCVIINKSRQKACWRCGKHGCTLARNPKVVAAINMQAAANALRNTGPGGLAQADVLDDARRNLR